MNQSLYRFGGKTRIGKHMAGQISIDDQSSPKLNTHFNTILSSKLQKRLADYNESKKPKVNVIHKDPLVRVQDYTKNLSQTIFSPQYSEPRNHFQTAEGSPLHKFGYGLKERERGTRERDVVNTLRAKLEQERSARRSITREVNDLKSTLQSLKANVTGDASRLPPTFPKRSRQQIPGN